MLTHVVSHGIISHHISVIFTAKYFEQENWQAISPDVSHRSFEARLLQLVAVRRTRFHGRQTPARPKRSGSRGSPGKASCQRQASATPISLAASERAHFIQGGAPHVQGAQHVVARLPRAAAAASCANQVAAVFRRTSTACSTNPDQHRHAGFQHYCTINVKRSTKLRSPK